MIASGLPVTNDLRHTIVTNPQAPPVPESSASGRPCSEVGLPSAAPHFAIARGSWAFYGPGLVPPPLPPAAAASMSSVSAAHQNGFGATARRDGWWIKPL